METKAKYIHRAAFYTTLLGRSSSEKLIQANLVRWKNGNRKVAGFEAVPLVLLQIFKVLRVITGYGVFVGLMWYAYIPIHPVNICHTYFFKSSQFTSSSFDYLSLIHISEPTRPY